MRWNGSNLISMTTMAYSCVLPCSPSSNVAANAGTAAAKDESAADWFPLIPSWFNDWRNRLADKGLALGATIVMDNIGNPTGGMRQGAINFGRLDLGVDADLEKLVGWTRRQNPRQHVLRSTATG